MPPQHKPRQNVVLFHDFSQVEIKTTEQKQQTQ